MPVKRKKKLSDEVTTAAESDAAVALAPNTNSNTNSAETDSTTPAHATNELIVANPIESTAASTLTSNQNR